MGFFAFLVKLEGFFVELLKPCCVGVLVLCIPVPVSGVPEEG
jgi:hypothetical protein